MLSPHLGCQRITFEPVNFSGPIHITTGLDFSPHAEWFAESNWTCPRMEQNGEILAILGKTNRSHLYLFSSYRLLGNDILENRLIKAKKFIGLESQIHLKQGKISSLTRIVVNYADKNPQAKPDIVWDRGMELALGHGQTGFETAFQEQCQYWQNIWDQFDITIEGDPENQQGIRFCIFQLHQTYHGVDSTLNIGAKGLTGEAYGGKAFWDTEAYCLQFYMFNNPQAAKNLLKYRYQLLPKAMERAGQLDCEGACYPVSSIDGEESCGAWQYSSLQIHVSGAIAFGIFHYTNVCGDRDFLYHEGMEMLIQICRFYASRVQQNPETLQYGFYGVMGVDEFHMMVNNNCFINYLVKKVMEFTVSVITEMEKNAPSELSAVGKKTGYRAAELEKWRDIAADMYIPRNSQTHIYEQHDGFFTLPHIDIDAIPVSDFPLYQSWSYDRLYRHDMIKQPDVLMMLFLYSQDFSVATKRANYDYYKPRCIHESSLSPSIHSILAAEIGNLEEACEFFRFATRLDLDDYNRNTWEGLHITSIAAAWMNIVYGFGGIRSDGPILSFHPSLPPEWQSYSFRILYQNSIVSVTVNQAHILFKTNNHNPITVLIYDKQYQINDLGFKLDLQQSISQAKGAFAK
jgi:Trehalose and maltose hydrolases (possible phosphorylases)